MVNKPNNRGRTSDLYRLNPLEVLVKVQRIIDRTMVSAERGCIDLGVSHYSISGCPHLQKGASLRGLLDAAGEALTDAYLRLDQTDKEAYSSFKETLDLLAMLLQTGELGRKARERVRFVEDYHRQYCE